MLFCSACPCVLRQVLYGGCKPSSDLVPVHEEHGGSESKPEWQLFALIGPTSDVEPVRCGAGVTLGCCFWLRFWLCIADALGGLVCAAAACVRYLDCR